MALTAVEPTPNTQRGLRLCLVGLALAGSLAACGGHHNPDPAAGKSATAAGELVGSTLADLVAKLREVKTADPTLATDEALARLDAGASLVPVRDAIEQMLVRKGLGLSEMMFRFSEGVASSLPAVAGIVVEQNTRPKYEREYKGGDRRDIMKGFVKWAVIRAMLVDDGPPKPFRSLFVGEKGPPPSVVDPAGNIVIKFPESRGSIDLYRWISEDRMAGTTVEALARPLGFP